MTSVDEDDSARRRPWKEGPEGTGGGAAGWLALSDDDLLFRIEALGPEHDADALLMEVVRSDRHFFIRQEAAKRIRDAELLKDHSGDRHIGQILVRVMNRAEDLVYLERLVVESRHMEVRKAAEAQLRSVLARAVDKRS
ncbi:MAG: hypothetical protein DMF80_03510 [Acidobacteria bacterium]|nr:MAG: hypothetical protein DMF80_03510 [Acidobacteriota bacterium]PYQ24147.1 MAG: hypothetical protein DMF81_06440 [Acidobacteriota bacterium]